MTNGNLNVRFGSSLAIAVLALAQADAQQPQKASDDNKSSAQSSTSSSRANSGAQSQANPYLRENNAWISLSGTVEQVRANSFELDYGDGRITVEMDDDDRDADGYALRSGDKVTVSGRIDDDLFETTSIEAGTVYVEKLGTYFFASSADEEDAPLIVAAMKGDPSIVGSVTDVRANEFVLDRGGRSVTVEVENMAYNPLDEEGYQRIEVGDIVSVTGTFDRDFFEGRELEARSIVTLFDHPG